jgi:hypothetical protein
MRVGVAVLNADIIFENGNKTGDHVEIKKTCYFYLVLR